MYYSAAAFSVSIRLNSKSPKTFDTIVSTNLCAFFFLIFDLWELQSSNPPTPPHFGAPLSKITS